MMTSKGAQRILDYRVFGHNIRRFPEYIRHYEDKRERWRSILQKNKTDVILRGQASHFRHTFLKLDKWYGNYKRLWQQYFAIL